MPWRCTLSRRVPGRHGAIYWATVLSAGTSGGAQLRSLVKAVRGGVRQWLGVAVPRELNVDADTLSRPARAAVPDNFFLQNLLQLGPLVLGP